MVCLPRQRRNLGFRWLGCTEVCSASGDAVRICGGSVGTVGHSTEEGVADWKHGFMAVDLGSSVRVHREVADLSASHDEGRYRNESWGRDLRVG
ncbi:hypothetical protein M6B38_177260 [Iris pallida]|uniref:Uncharacterized protein n=1 Tax=Iris pallida TaxID=29817 RepID=A0AAX6EPA5_IRIPA|nr:hypothetical protein M6B38_108470 [Iris pallida]KAJ6806047.1 hypothetical protein M6B38_177260 [Iris pallida]